MSCDDEYRIIREYIKTKLDNMSEKEFQDYLNGLGDDRVREEVKEGIINAH